MKHKLFIVLIFPGISWAQEKLIEVIKSECATLHKVFGSKLNHLQFLLLGETGSGKSSVVNTLNTAIVNNERVSYLSPAGRNAKQTTRTLKMYTIKTDDDSLKLPFKVTDFRGFGSSESGVSEYDVERAIRGQIEDGSEIPAGKATTPEEHDKGDPSKYSFLILLVIDIRMLSSWGSTVIRTHEKLQAVIETANDLNLPVAIILTHCDNYDENVKKNAANLHYSPRVRNAVEDASNKLGVPEQRIFPVANYSTEQISNPAKSIQMLLPVYYLLNDMKQRLKQMYPELKPTGLIESDTFKIDKN